MLREYTKDDEYSPSEYTTSATESGSATSARAGQITNLSEQAVVPLPMDVIFGRGQLQHSVPGNIRFHSLIELYMPRYNAATCKRHKSLVVNDIYHAVKATGRFLKMERGNTGYIEVDEAAGKEKIGQAIRYKQRKSTKDMSKKSPTTRRDTVTKSTTTVGGKQHHLHELHQEQSPMSLAASQQHASVPAVATSAAATTSRAMLEQAISDIHISNSSPVAMAQHMLLSVLQEQCRQASGRQSVGMNMLNEPLFTSFAAPAPQAPAATASCLLPSSSAIGMALPVAADPSSFASIPPLPFLTQKPATASLKQEDEEEEIISDHDLMSVLGPPDNEYEPNAFPSDHPHHTHQERHHHHHQNP
jgi:hypothetical protein